jgi:hypothetical protein
LGVSASASTSTSLAGGSGQRFPDPGRALCGLIPDALALGPLRRAPSPISDQEFPHSNPWPGGCQATDGAPSPLGPPADDGQAGRPAVDPARALLRVVASSPDRIVNHALLVALGGESEFKRRLVLTRPQDAGRAYELADEQPRAQAPARLQRKAQSSGSAPGARSGQAEVAQTQSAR